MPSQNPGQLILVGVPGAELDPDSARLFREIQPGGFILFGRNIKTPAQLRKLIDDLRDLSDVEPIITIDQEGGRVSRLKLIGSELAEHPAELFLRQTLGGADPIDVDFAVGTATHLLRDRRSTVDDRRPRIAVVGRDNALG